MTRLCLSRNYYKSVKLINHIKNLQVLPTEMFMAYTNISQLFQSRNNDYNLRQFLQFNLPNVRRDFDGQKVFHFLARKNGILPLMNLRGKHH